MVTINIVHRLRLGILGFLLFAFTAVFATSSSLYITTQRFEHGLMIWRQDTGTIYVLDDQFRAQVFPLSSYAAWPDNPIPPVSGTVQPLFGFGKVWGNDATVRQRLGHPLLPEIGFVSAVVEDNENVAFTQIDTSVIHISSSGGWYQSIVILTPTPCPYPYFFPYESDVCPQGAAHTTDAAYQPFEHGFMIWESDTGEILVFVSDSANNTGGRWTRIPQATYATYPDAPPPLPNSEGITLLHAFGRVWAHANLGFQRTLGQATAPETAYPVTLQIGGSVRYTTHFVSLPSGQIVAASTGADFGFIWQLLP